MTNEKKKIERQKLTESFIANLEGKDKAQIFNDEVPGLKVMVQSILDKKGNRRNIKGPLVIISSFLFLLIFSYKIERERKKRIAEEEAELKRREAEFLAKREATLKKLEELKQFPVGKVSQANIFDNNYLSNNFVKKY